MNLVGKSVGMGDKCQPAYSLIKRRQRTVLLWAETGLVAWWHGGVVFQETVFELRKEKSVAKNEGALE